ncbi:MAG: VCBS domain-containing protein, partial [Planctomycetales bacterium]|nr:VCBS domain-containing protein [Planctomycetales bacterium]
AVADTATAIESGGVANATVGSDATGNVLSNDTDVDAGDTKTVVGVAAGTVGSTSGNVASSVSGSFGSITIGADGSYTYVVDETNAAVQALRTSSETLTDTFTYTMADAGGLESTTTVTITITGANDAPETDDVSFTTDEDSSGLFGSLTSTDVDHGDSATFELVSGPLSGDLVLNSDGSFEFVPGLAFQDLAVGETRQVSFVYRVLDTAGAQDTATATITVEGRNDGPTANNDLATTLEQTAALVDVLANDSDVDASDTLVVSSARLLTGSGVVEVVGDQVKFTPGAEYNSLAEGEQAFVTIEYDVRDPHGAVSTALLTFAIEGERDQVAVTVTSTQVGEDSPAAIPIDVRRIDTHGEQLVSLRLAGLPQGAVLTDGVGGIVVSGGASQVIELLGWDLDTLEVLPPRNFAGTISLELTLETDYLSDPTQTYSFDVEVVPRADSPVLSVAPNSGFAGTWIPLRVATALTDRDGSESLELHVSGVPFGAMLTDGVRTLVSNGPTQEFDLTQFDLARLAFKGVNLADPNVGLEFTLASIETANGDRAEVRQTLQLLVVPPPNIPAEPVVVPPGPADATDPVGDATQFDGGSASPRVQQLAAGERVDSTYLSSEPVSSSPGRSGVVPDPLELTSPTYAPSGDGDAELAMTGEVLSELQKLTLDDVQELIAQQSLLNLDGSVDFHSANLQTNAWAAEEGLREDLELARSNAEAADERNRANSVTTRLGLLWSFVRSLGTVRDRTDLDPQRDRNRR